MQQTMGGIIAERRKEKGLTQMELAEKMGVTDKAVSKWERDLSCPDVNTLPKLAETLGITLDELLQSGQPRQDAGQGATLLLVCRAVALAMGVALFVLALLGQVDVHSGLSMAGIGIACLALHLFLQEKGKGA